MFFKEERQRDLEREQGDVCMTLWVFEHLLFFFFFVNIHFCGVGLRGRGKRQLSVGAFICVVVTIHPPPLFPLPFVTKTKKKKI